MDQIVKTSDVMTSVTSNPDEVKDTDKVGICIVPRSNKTRKKLYVDGFKKLFMEILFLKTFVNVD